MTTAQPEHPYIFGDPATDRQRLAAQTQLLGTWLYAHAPHLVPPPVHRILELGCGEGQLGRVLCAVYPMAYLVGIDSDPRAVATAQEMAAAEGLTQAHYVAGDIQNGLPDGPFDLIYASLILLHTPQVEKVLTYAYEALAPGGLFWIKDMDHRYLEATNLPAYQRLARLGAATFAGLGLRLTIGDQLPELLAAAGFEVVQAVDEVHPLGGSDPAGRTMLAATLGAIYNARHLISRMQGVSEGEILQLYADIVNAAMYQSTPLGQMTALNLLARRPR